MTDTRLSIAVPCYNGEKYIAKTIESILPQLADVDELLIIDDG